MIFNNLRESISAPGNVKFRPRGYTQQDVVEVAKVLTGWGTETRHQGYGFFFAAW
ncbi:MAG: hypothetical protein QOK38_496 [Acidobacteriaceae bacterium]|jgi:uncharacterized protein (DUF1800 family)|nr:hypothetical protein [Acidobacteriaceae bacterium]